MPGQFPPGGAPVPYPVPGQFPCPPGAPQGPYPNVPYPPGPSGPGMYGPGGPGAFPPDGGPGYGGGMFPPIPPGSWGPPGGGFPPQPGPPGGFGPGPMGPYGGPAAPGGMLVSNYNCMNGCIIGLDIDTNFKILLDFSSQACDSVSNSIHMDIYQVQ